MRRCPVTPVEQAFEWLEHTDLSLWVRGESLFAFPFILVLHTIGMGFAAGTGAAVALRILGVAKNVPLSALANFYPVLWLALAFAFWSEAVQWVDLRIRSTGTGECQYGSIVTNSASPHSQA